MVRLIQRHPVTLRERLHVLRTVVVGEAPDGPDAFVAADGPFSRYRRTLVDDGDEIIETIEYQLAIPFLWWIFAKPVRHALRQLPNSEAHQPWWAPPDRLDGRASSILALLAIASLSVGYLNTLLTQTVAFAADEFGSTNRDQTVSLAVVRMGIVIALIVVSLADKRGRRRLIIATATVAPIVAALGALAGNLAMLTASQAVARPLALSLDMVIAVVATEEMPKGARAYALSLLALSTGLGAGLCVMALPVADLNVHAWRFVYILPLVFLVPVKAIRERLPESRRFDAPHAEHTTLRAHWQRFVLLAGAGLFINLLVAPASGLQNEYLKDLRGFSATSIAVFTVLTQTPAGIGVVIGGELADRYGRRAVGAVALVVGAVATALTFYVTGWPLWAWSIVGSVIGGAAVPALGVYQTELFPTAIRSRAKAGIIVVTLVGSTIGLLGAGIARDRGVSYFNIMGLLMIGPLLVSIVIWFLYPETAHLELETLNPEDRPSP